MGYEPGAAAGSLRRAQESTPDDDAKTKESRGERWRFVMTWFEFLEAAVPETISSSQLPRQYMLFVLKII